MNPRMKINGIDCELVPDKVEKSDAWAQTSSATRFDLFDPKPEQFKIADIMHSLSLQVRYNGHCSQFHSVLEHSVFVAEIIKRKGGTDLEQMLGLLHDVTEAYIGDMVTPLKLEMPKFREVEDAIWDAFAKTYGLPAVMPDIIKVADRISLMSEKLCLLGPSPGKWGYSDVELDPEVIRTLIYLEGVSMEARVLRARKLFHDIGLHLAGKLNAQPGATPEIHKLFLEFCKLPLPR